MSKAHLKIHISMLFFSITPLPVQNVKHVFKNIMCSRKVKERDTNLLDAKSHFHQQKSPEMYSNNNNLANTLVSNAQIMTL